VIGAGGKTVNGIKDKTGAELTLEDDGTVYITGKNGSAEAALKMVEAIVKDQRRILPVCIELQGEYGINNCYLGVPAVLGKNGVERIIELDLNEQEKALLETSRVHVKEVMDVLDKLGK
jgi:malate/lactate dehydrogenase